MQTRACGTSVARGRYARHFHGGTRPMPGKMPACMLPAGSIKLYKGLKSKTAGRKATSPDVRLPLAAYVRVLAAVRKPINSLCHFLCDCVAVITRRYGTPVRAKPSCCSASCAPLFRRRRASIHSCPSPGMLLVRSARPSLSAIVLRLRCRGALVVFLLSSPSRPLLLLRLE